MEPICTSFRPLDGESFSKLFITTGCKDHCKCFRPLDGESFSKHPEDTVYNKPEDLVSVP